MAMSEHTRKCVLCRKDFNAKDDDGWFVRVSGNVIDGDPDGDWLCSDQCAARYFSEVE